MALEIREISKSFNDLPVLDAVSFTVDEGEFVCVVGPSGCGKTTLLRIIGGLEPPTKGHITMDGEPLKKKDIGFVFQEYALLPWRTVIENIEFGLELRGIDKTERKRRAMELIELVGLEGFERSFPKELSGGMKQRVGIARALAVNPKILLMDEPFASLDAQTRNKMQEEVLRVWEKTRKTVIFVTHSVDEAVFLADKVVVLSRRPAKICKEIIVEAERPRDRLNRNLIEKRKEILDLLSR
jgi:NitT/TauT family transport system ATP-binding protein